ncbi:MAG: Thymidylate kinase [Candelina submexicana]|nr:MAG: Thymidylate kinase [Candelina submexicana]
MSTNSSPYSRGTLIVIEGLDKAGKSTQCARLVERLKREGKKVRHMRFPDRSTPIGRMIDSYLKGQAQQEDHVIHLLFSANRWEAAEQIKADIAQGITIVIDRYYYSGCVYSAAKEIPGLDLQWARWPEVGLPRPDICIFLSISAEDASKRGGFGGEKYESKAMQGRVRQLFDELRESSDREDIHVIDAGAAEEIVEASVIRLALECMRCVESGSRGRQLRQVLPSSPEIH